ncbi:MAG: RNB domain-containing ribonuclease [Planctomycetota bacterium]
MMRGAEPDSGPRFHFPTATEAPTWARTATRRRSSRASDLLGDLGGPDEPTEETERPDVEVVFGEGVDSDLEGYDGGARELIAARPPAFGPMEHGAPPYHDENSEEMEILRSFRVRMLFPDDVRAEVGRLPSDPPPGDYEGDSYREDLRRERIFTIDGEDARDYDDAIGIREVDDGYELGVHIADVSHYVRPGTALDAEAVARATSVYLADQVVPMLPEELSNQLCSLVPDRDRLAFSVIMRFDRQGRRKAFYVTKSVIRSMRRCTYRGVQELLDGEDNERTRALKDLEPDLRMFADWTRKQQEIRDRKGSMRMQSVERKFRFDEKGEVVGIYEAANYFSQTLIEETALAANQAVGDYFKNRGLPTIYRIHPEKDPEEVAQIIEMLDKHGCRVPKKDRLTGRDIGDLIRWARRQRNSEAMISRIMGLMERAIYELRHHDERAEHFGLAREHYLHFTSPIRRYPDLMVHRMLDEVLRRGEEVAIDFQRLDVLQNLTEIAGHASGQADMAAMAEVAIGDLKVCQYMEPRIGEAAKVVIQRVSRGGFEIKYPDELVTGFVPARSIGERVEHDGVTLKISARRGFVKIFREGDVVEVVLKDVDFVRLRLLFELAS